MLKIKAIIDVRNKLSKLELGFLTTIAKEAFLQLWQAFTKVSVFWYFNLKWYIQIEIDASGYAIGGVLS